MEIEIIEWIPAFLLVLVRVSAFMVTLPFFPIRPYRTGSKSDLPHFFPGS